MFEKIRKRIEQDIVLRNVVLGVSILVIVVCTTAFSLSIFTRHGEKYEVPNFSGMTIEQANLAAQKLELNLEIVDSIYVSTAAKGVILEQYPKPGNFVKSKRRIFLTINTFKPKKSPMPYVAGFSLRQAKNKLVGAGFTIEQLKYVDDIATNNIIKQTYKDKTVTASSNIVGEVGTGVVLVVGLNPVDKDPIVPGIVGLSIEQAKNRLWEYGFNVGSIDLDSDINYENINDAKIYAQSLPKSARAMYGRTISMSATLDKGLVEKGIADNEIASRKEISKAQAEQNALDRAAENATVEE
ncbi:MAG: PASTA domain-containing protein [Rikenellaceae bacterium]